MIEVIRDVTEVTFEVERNGLVVNLQPVINRGGTSSGGAVDSVNGQTGTVVLQKTK